MRAHKVVGGLLWNRTVLQDLQQKWLRIKSSCSGYTKKCFPSLLETISSEFSGPPSLGHLDALHLQVAVHGGPLGMAGLAGVLVLLAVLQVDVGADGYQKRSFSVILILK